MRNRELKKMRNRYHYSIFTKCSEIVNCRSPERLFMNFKLLGYAGRRIKA